jgi:Toprim domain-containing protein
MFRAPDPLTMPGTANGPKELLDCSVPLAGTAGQAYVEQRGIPLKMAAEAAVQFAPAFNRRPAVIVGLHGRNEELVSVHGRYLNVLRGQDKMLTIGPGNGIINILGGWRTDPLIIVEGLFDALSLSVCGFASAATIGRWASWLPEAVAGRTVWLAFDTGRPGEEEFERYASRLSRSLVRRMLPPARCKDWNTALVKLGASSVMQWVHACLAKQGDDHNE